MSGFEVLRRQVAIGGVARSGAQVTPDCLVELMQEGETEVREKTRSRNDGVFYFMDLPDGTYQVRATARGKVVSGNASVARTQDGKLFPTWLELQFQRRADSA